MNPTNEGVSTKNVYVSTIITSSRTSLYPTKVAKAETNEPGFLNFLKVEGLGGDVTGVKCVSLVLGTRKILPCHEFASGILRIWFVAEWKSEDGTSLSRVKKSQGFTSNLVVTVETEPTGVVYQVEIENIEISISDGIIDP
jgi:hypothetical protein